MIALIKRNLKIYFANKIGVLMSCLGALISFFIYIVFLQQNLISSWQSLHYHFISSSWSISQRSRKSNMG